jgi:hypothetical protein
MKTPKNIDELRIEHNVPIPPKRGGGIHALLAKLEASDSVMIPGRTPATAASAIRYAQISLPGRRFTSRTVDGGVRIWRTK